jgi:hypothetical protein
MPPAVRLLRLQNFPVLRMLQLEEALLRADSRNWFILVDGAAAPAIVLGVSGKPDQMVHLPQAAAAGVPLIKRFTGGGTVAVDGGTLFTSLILSTAALPEVVPYPRPIMAWTEELYGAVLRQHGDFALREHGEGGGLCGWVRGNTERERERLGVGGGGERGRVWMVVSWEWGSGVGECARSVNMAGSYPPNICIRSSQPLAPTPSCRLCVWGAQIWRERTGHHGAALAPPHLPPLGLCALHDAPAAPPQPRTRLQGGQGPPRLHHAPQRGRAQQGCTGGGPGQLPVACGNGGGGEAARVCACGRAHTRVRAYVCEGTTGSSANWAYIWRF